MAQTLQEENARLKKAYSKRLTEVMLEQGHRAPRSKLEANPRALQKIVDAASVETARKYLTGEAMPGPAARKRIADWLGARQAYLDYGEPPKYLADVDIPVDPISLGVAISAVQDAVKNASVTYSEQSIAEAAAIFYTYVTTNGTLNSEKIVELIALLEYFHDKNVTSVTQNPQKLLEILDLLD